MAECTADQPLKFDPDVVDFVLEFGPSVCATVEECRATLSSVGTTKITPAAVARIMNGMIKISERNQDNSSLQGIWGEPTPNKKDEGVSWNGKAFVQAVLELVPSFVWKEVFHQLDFQGFSLKNSHSFRSLLEALRYGLQLQGQTRPDQFPVEAFYRTWNNVEGQVSLIKCCLSPSNYDIFCFADLPLHACNVEILKTSADKSYDLKEIHTWKSLQLLELLLSFGEKGQYVAAQELFQFPTVHCPDILLLGLTQLNTPMTMLRQELMTSLFPIFLGNHSSSGVILQHAWHSGPNSVRPIMILAMADWYLKSDYDQAKLSRILDVAQDLKALPLLLNANNHPFIIDLACLASRREFLKLDKWLTDKIREHGETFVGSLVSVVKRRIPQISGREDNVPKSAQLPAEVINTIIQCLHQCVGKVAPELGENIVSLVSTYNMFVNKARPPPSNNTPQPGVLRSHRSMDPGFNNIASPTLFPTPNPNDPFSALGSTLAGLNLAGVGGSFGGGMNQLGPTPGSPSRLLGPSFGSQSGTGFPGPHGLQQLGPPNSGPGRNASTPPMGQNPNMGMLSGRLANPLGGPGPGPGLGALLPLGGGGGEPRRVHNSNPQSAASIIGEDVRLFNEIQPNEISKEAEDEANSYFHRIYSKPPDPTMSIDDVLDLLKRFQDSTVRREREVFTCMLRNLFEEYKFFPQYPEKELHTTAQLFGGIIEHGLVTTYLQLGVALRFVVDALKKSPGSKMYYFGIAALDRFRTKLKDYPQYCQHLATIPHYQEFPTHLLDYIDYGSRSQEPPRPIQASRTGASALPPAAASSSLNSILTAPPTAASAPGQGKPVGSVSATAISKSSSHSGPSITGRPSIANATNINTLLVAIEKDDKMVLPPEIVQDKTAFIFNNLNQMNLSDKCKELKEILGNDYWPWIAQYLVMKRASIELNFHTLYSNLLDTIKQKEFYDAVLKETHRNIKILLRADKSASNFSDRSLLKNLGHWLGLITLMRNKPVILDDLDIKSLIIEAYRKGLQDLLFVVPFAAKIIEACARSIIFKPPCPWTMAILNVLAELHREPDMKLNLKFEIEVLCKALSLEVLDLKPSAILKDEEAFKVTVRQLPDVDKSGGKAVGSRVIPPPVSESSLNKTSESSSQSSTVTPQPEDLSSSASGPPATSSASAPNVSQHQQIGGPTIGGLATTVLASTGAAQDPKFSYSDVDTSNLASLLTHVTVNSTIPLFQTQPTLKQYVRAAVDKAIHDLLHPVVDRSIKYTVNACESIIKKDFALDPEENRMRHGAHNMMRYLTAGMAMITSRDHIFIAISGNLKTSLLAAIRPTSLTPAMKEQVEQASTVVAQENMELACVYIQKTAVEKALLEIDKRLHTEYEARRIAKIEGRRYVDPIMLGYQMDRMPEQVRIKATGAVSQQLAVYEDFSRNIPGFIPPPEGEVSFLTPKFHPRLDLPPPPPSQNNLPITGPAPPSANDDLIAIYDKLISQMENYSADLSHSPSNIAPTLLNSIRHLLEMINNAKTSRSIVTAISLLQKAVEGLLEGVQIFIGDPEMIRYRDSHLMILKALQDSRAFGEQWVNRQVTKTLIEARSDLKYNVDAVDILIRANLVNMLQFDAYLSNAVEKGNNLQAMAFAMPLVRMYCVDDRYSVGGGVNDGDLFNTADILCRVAATSRSPPEGLLALVEALRMNNSQPPPPQEPIVNTNTFVADRAIPNVSTLHSGLNQAREYDDPSGLVEKSELLLREWIRLYLTLGTPKDSNKAFTQFIGDLNVSGILKSDDVITRFFRISVQCCVNQVYQGLQAGSLAMVRGKVYQSTDALVRLVALLVRHIGETSSPTPKINLLNKFLGIVAGLLIQDHDMQKADFQQLPFHRLFIMLFYDLNVADPIYETIAMQQQDPLDPKKSNELLWYLQTLTGFSNTLHILCPTKVPGFAYAWLEIVGNRLFIARMLALASDQKCWAMYCQLLLDLFKFLQPFMRNADMAPSVQTLYRGTLRVLLVILHDFPDFLCDYCYHFLDAIPPNCIQMRNLVLSAFPRNMRLPDPFTANLKFEMMADTALPPRILSNVAAMITPANFKTDLDSYLKTRAPVTFLSELRTSLQVQYSESGNRYSIPLLNALVLYCGSQHISVIRARGQTPNMSTVAHTSHMDIFQNLAVDLDTEGRYLFLNALANQLRFPSSHTHYFSLIILYLFAQSNTEVVQEQITRVLLERLVVNRPHPWGLLVTFIELIKNPAYKFWSHEFVHCAPEVEKLFESVARSCMVTKTPAPTNMQPQQQQVMHLGQANGPMMFNPSAESSSILDVD